MSKENALVLRWVRVGIICGILGDICYGLAIAVPLPTHLGHVVFWSFGPLMIAGSIGMYHFIKQHRNSIALQVGTIFLMFAGLSLTMMAVVQTAVMETLLPLKPDIADTASYEAWRMGLASGNAVQLGMDVVLDIFVMTSTILLAVSMFSHPRLGRTIASTGIIIGLLGLFLNVKAFPTPPADAGSFDIGPALVLWFLAVRILLIVNYRWLRRSLEVIAAA